MNIITIPTLRTRAQSIGFSDKGVFLLSINRARAAARNPRFTREERLNAVVAQLRAAQSRLEISSAYKAGQRGESHARIATANSLHADVANCINDILANYETK